MNPTVISSGTSLSLAPRSGTRVAVAGGCGGIGRCLVAELLARDCRVAVIDMPASIADHQPPDGVMVLAANATREDEVDNAAKALGESWDGVDAFVNLCGFTLARRPLQEYSLAEWREVVQGNLDAAFLLATRLLPLLSAGRNPTIVNVASSLAVKASPGYGPYSAEKAGILALTRMLAEENAPGIRVNAVAPNAVRTEFLSGGTGRHADSKGELLDLEAYGSSLPLQRAAEPADVVGPVLFLLGPASLFMTGQTLHINGGLWQP